MWILLQPADWVLPQNCHSFYNFLTDNPGSVWQEESLEAAVNISQHSYETAMPVFFLFLHVGRQLSEQHDATETLKINLAWLLWGRGILGFCIQALDDQKMFTSMLVLYVVKRWVFFTRGNGFVAHYLKYISY